jgi:prepilin-type N-terminal cleavage/methylation domain-containing protein
MEMLHRRRSAFTMVELLVVIAIIALLAAIAFPVFFQVRKTVKRTTCLTNLKQIGQALGMYKLDYGAYPPALFGQYDALTTNAGVLIVRRTYLYPQYLKSPETFHCPLDPVTSPATPVPADQLPAELKPLAPNVYRIGDLYQAQIYDPNPLSPGTVVVRPFDPYFSYDLQLLTPTTGRVAYRVDWTGLPYSGPGTNEQTADPRIQANFSRQLKYKNPPADTVVTMCPFHREGSAIKPSGNSLDNVLFLGGAAQTIPTSATEPAGADGQPAPPSSSADLLDPTKTIFWTVAQKP